MVYSIGYRIYAVGMWCIVHGIWRFPKVRALVLAPNSRALILGAPIKGPPHQFLETASCHTLFTSQLLEAERRWTDVIAGMSQFSLGLVRVVMYSWGNDMSVYIYMYLYIYLYVCMYIYI